MKTYKFLQYISFVFAFVLLGTDAWGQCVIVKDVSGTTVGTAAGSTISINNKCENDTFTVEWAASCPNAGTSVGTNVLESHNTLEMSVTALAGNKGYQIILNGTNVLNGTVPNPTMSLTFPPGLTGGCTGTTCANDTIINLSFGSLKQRPNMTLSSTSICNGTATTLSPTCGDCTGGSYTFNDGSSSTTAATLSTGSLSTGSYTYSVTGIKTGCSVEKSLTVTVVDNPTPVGPTESTCLNSGPVVLTPTCAGCGTITYVWDDATTTTTAGTLTANKGIEGVYTYDITATNSSSCTATTTGALSVNPLPAVTITTVADACSGNNVSLSAVTATGTNTCGNCTPVISSTTTYLWSTASTAASISGSTATRNTTGTATTTLTTESVSYQVSITANNGCTQTATVGVDYHGAPDLTITPANIGMCTGLDTSIAVSSSNYIYSGLDYTWSSSPGGQISGSTSTATVTTNSINTPGTYDFTVLATAKVYGCTASETSSVTVSAPPNIDLTVNPWTDTVLCSGASVELNDVGLASSAGLIRTWNVISAPGGYSITTTTNPVNTPVLADGGVYLFEEVLSDAGCESRDTVRVRAVQAPNLSFPSQSNKCAGQNATISAAVSGGDTPISYTWNFNGSPAGTTTSQIFSAGVLSVGSYTLSVSAVDNVSCGGTASTTFDVIDCGQTSINNNNNNRVCEVDLLQLQANTTLSGGCLIYKWELYDGTIIENTSPILNIPINPSMPDTITTILIVGEICEANPGYFTPLTPEIYDETVISRVSAEIVPSDTVVCYGSNITFSANCINCVDSLIGYEWNGVTVSSYPFNYTLTNVTGTTPVVLRAQNQNNCYDTISTNAFVKPLPGLNLTPIDTAFYCPTGSVNLVANTTSTPCVNCNYTWSTGQISDNITVNQTKKYYVTVSLNGCTEIDSVPAKKRGIPKPIITNKNGVPITSSSTPPYLILCGGAPDTLYVDSASCPGCGLEWSNNSTTPFIAVSSDGGYYVEGLDSFGCLGISDPVLVINSTEGMGTMATANPTQICSGNPVTIKLDPCVGCSYYWYNVDSSTVRLLPSSNRSYTTNKPGSYFGVVQNANGCRFTSNIVNVTTATLLPPLITTSTDSLCKGQTATLTASNYNPLYSYQWYKDGAQISGATGHTYQVNKVTAILTGDDYYVEVSFPNGCIEQSNTLTIYDASFAPAIATANNATEICNGSTLTISTTANAGWTYQWYRDGVQLAGTGSAYLADIAGYYYAEVTNNLFCVERTDSILISTSSLAPPTASTNTPTICPGDTGRLSASICVGCEYQWFNANTGLNVVGQDSFNASFYNAAVTSTGNYYAIVQKGVCTENSDTVSIVLENVPFPTLTSNENIVCNGVNATLAVKKYIGADYVWMKDNQEIIGALNDTFYLVNNPLKAGIYTVQVDYATGCSDTSNAITIADGTFDAFIRVDTIAPNSPDSIICNTIGEDLVAYTTPSGKIGTVQLFEWFKDGVRFSTSTAAIYNNANLAGDYKVKMTDTRGCFEESNVLPLREINFIPHITTDVSEICGAGGAAILTITNPCSGCAYNWLQGNVPTGHTGTQMITQTGLTGAGLYKVEVDREGCIATSNVVSIAYNGALNTVLNSTDTSICAGDSITIFRQAGNGAGNYTFQWLWSSTSGVSGTEVPLATTFAHTTNLAGYYTLEVTKLDGFGQAACVDTSAELRLYEVQAPDSFRLDLTNVSPLPASGSVVDLDVGLFPAYLGTNPFYTNGNYSTTPFNGALSANAGLVAGVQNNNHNFLPDDSLAGYHLIIYTYDTLGCKFKASDILQVLDPAEIVVTNLNPNAVSYEACVNDTLAITISNYTFNIDSVYLFDLLSNYDTVSIVSTSITDSIYPSGDTVYNGTVLIVVPEWSKASYIKIASANGDTATTPYVLIHNEDLSFSGLPTELCSNGSPVVLKGVPAGGTFRVQYLNGPLANTYGNSIMRGDTLFPTLIDSANYQNELQNMRIWYNYTSKYTNGQLCPDLDTTTQYKLARAVHLSSITYFPIATSQTREELVDLVNVVMPYKSNPNVRTSNYSFSGSFTNPVGNPVYFLPATATAGQKYELTYSVHNGSCTKSVADSIRVIAPPLENNLGTSLSDTMCRIDGNFTLQRYNNSNYTYSALPKLTGNPAIVYADTANRFVIRSTNNNQGLTLVNPALGSERYTYNPANVIGNYDTLVIEYLYRRTSDSLLTGTKIDTQEYIRGSIVIPIYIEDTFTVNIVDTVVQSVYCEADEIHLLAADTIGGYFMLFGGSGQYQDPNGDTLTYGYINPYEVHQNESTDVSYNLVYIWEGLACRNIDSMRITIPEPPNASFSFAAADSIYCKTDMPDIISNVVALPDTGKWYIDEILQSNFTFDPSVLSVGSHIVKHSVFDTFGCVTSEIDTFEVRALPVLSMTPQLSTEYCNNDTITEFIVSPNPTCQQFATGSASVKTEVFDVFTPIGWTIEHVNTGGSNWLQAPAGGLAGGSGVTVPSSNQLENTWLITDPINFDQGKVYQITYWVKTGCPTGTCSPAAMRLKIGQGANSAALISTLADHPNLSNTNYTQYSVTYNCPATATYNIGFQCYSGNTQSSDLFVDQFEIKDISAQGCLVGGVGTVSGVGASQIADSLFIFDPTISSPGNVHFVYSYTDSYGCGDSLVQDIEIKPVPLVSFTPLDSAYCANAPVDIVVPSPLLGGTFTSSLSNLKGQLSNTTGSVIYDPNNDGIDYISYTYTNPATNCTNIAYDTVLVVPMVDSAIIDGVNVTLPGYCEDAAGIVLNALPYNGTAPNPGAFYGNGVRNGLAGPGAASFYPDSAVLDAGRTGNMVLTYIYTTSTGCVDTTRFTTRVHKLPKLSFLNLPDSICYNDTMRQIYVNNRMQTGPMGNIVSNDTLELNVIGGFTNPTPTPFLSPTDNILHPNGAGYGYKPVKYVFTDKTYFCKDTLIDSVRVDTVPHVYFTGLKPATPPHFFCENDAPSVIYAFPPYKVGSGYLQVGNQVIDSSFYEVIPAAMATPPNTADYQLYYTYTDDHGCTEYAQDSFEIRSYPRITLTIPSQYCDDDSLVNLMNHVTPTGGVFSDNLAPTAIQNDSMFVLNARVGERTIYYDYVDPATTCRNGDENIVNVYHNTVFDFDIIGGCAGATVSFEPDIQNLLAGVDSLTSVIWHFDTSAAATVVLPTSPTGVANETHIYGLDGIYGTSLTLVNQGICSTIVTKPLVISPYVADIHLTAYETDFQADQGGWYAKPVTNVSRPNAWWHGGLWGNTITEPGNKAWVTFGQDSSSSNPNRPYTYLPGDVGTVYSPCFDLVDAQRPMVVLDIWRDMSQGIDGAVWEYYDEFSNTWQVLGKKGKGIKWYNSDFLLARPGNQQNLTYPQGWTGESWGWENTRYRLDNLKGRDNVRFRLSFASDPQTVLSGKEGMAFDNIWIGERTRNVLVEHFSNPKYVSPFTNADMKYIDEYVYGEIFNTTNGLDVNLLQYQSGMKDASDALYNNFTAGPNARSNYYGISEEGELLVDGLTVNGGRSESISSNNLDYEMLQYPKFDIDISQMQVTNGNVDVTAVVTANEIMGSSDYRIHTVIVEDSIVATVPNTYIKKNIVREMLPDPSGESRVRSWLVGNQETVTYTWPVASFIQNPTHLHAIVFIQDYGSQQIFQAQTTQDLSVYHSVSVKDIEEGDPVNIISQVKVYPNPANNYLNVEFSEALEGEHDWQMVDVLGRTVVSGRTNDGDELFTIDVERLSAGSYFFIIRNDKVYTQRKIIISRN